MGELRAPGACILVFLVVVTTGCSTHTQSDTGAVSPSTEVAQTSEVSAERPSAWEGLVNPPPDIATGREQLSDEALFQDLMDNHWIRIFPTGGRNVGGPQFFKYIYENLATNHDLFLRYSQFYCGVSGSIVRPRGERRAPYDIVKIKAADGSCVLGKYYRCCWPCSCDIMKHARAEEVRVTLPLDPNQTTDSVYVLTIGDPCAKCNESPCPDLPPEVTAYQCKDGATANGLRVKDGQLTTGKEGRLVFAVLHEAAPASESEDEVSSDLMARCTPRINATTDDLKEMGGMGNIFVDVALVNSEETPTNSFEDLCE